MLRFEVVEKSYRQGGNTVHALRGASFAIDDTGFFAVMGPSGSGKSTLLHLAAGLDKPDRGKVIIDDYDIGAMSQRALTRMRREHVGVVFQRFNLIATLTARQNIALPGVIDGRPRKWITERVSALLDELGLADRADHRPDALSGGEQQRVAIARALLFEPKLLLADEPTGNLDSATSERLWSQLQTIAGRHAMTILMVTHEPAAVAHCRRAFVLGDGVCKGDFEVEGLDASGVASRYQQFGR
jgi:putative ABC transport system ATP-binding protein